jgi:hypothetical protein
MLIWNSIAELRAECHGVRVCCVVHTLDSAGGKFCLEALPNTLVRLSALSWLRKGLRCAKYACGRASGLQTAKGLRDVNVFTNRGLRGRHWSAPPPSLPQQPPTTPSIRFLGL